MTRMREYAIKNTVSPESAEENNILDVGNEEVTLSQENRSCRSLRQRIYEYTRGRISRSKEIKRLLIECQANVTSN